MKLFGGKLRSELPYDDTIINDLLRLSGDVLNPYEIFIQIIQLPETSERVAVSRHILYYKLNNGVGVGIISMKRNNQTSHFMLSLPVMGTDWSSDFVIPTMGEDGDLYDSPEDIFERWAVSTAVATPISDDHVGKLKNAGFHPTEIVV